MFTCFWNIKRRHNFVYFKYFLFLKGETRPTVGDSDEKKQSNYEPFITDFSIFMRRLFDNLVWWKTKKYVAGEHGIYGSSMLDRKSEGMTWILMKKWIKCIIELLTRMAKRSRDNYVQKVYDPESQNIPAWMSKKWFGLRSKCYKRKTFRPFSAFWIICL
jgi:hypothetical protein